MTQHVGYTLHHQMREETKKKKKKKKKKHSIIMAVVADTGEAALTLNMADWRTVGEASLMLHVE